ncbi:MAG: hypothetical protein ACREEM_05250 [Blastocatellia bacterium]
MLLEASRYESVVAAASQAIAEAAANYLADVFIEKTERIAARE